MRAVLVFLRTLAGWCVGAGAARAGLSPSPATRRAHRRAGMRFHGGKARSRSVHMASFAGKPAPARVHVTSSLGKRVFALVRDTPARGKMTFASVRGAHARGKMMFAPVRDARALGKMVLASVRDAHAHGKITIVFAGTPPSEERAVHPLEKDALSPGTAVSPSGRTSLFRLKRAFPPSDPPYARANPGIARGDVTAPC